MDLLKQKIGKGCRALRGRLGKTAVVFVSLYLLTVLLPSDAASAAQGTDGKIDEDRSVDINFDNAPLREVISAISQITGKNFLIDDTVKGSVTIVASTKIPQEEVFKVFESILEVKGYRLVPAGEVIKVVPDRVALKKSVPISTGKGPETVEAEDRLITRLIPIEYADAGELVSILAALTSEASHLATYTPTNTIILTDAASNVKRILTVIEHVDVPGFEEKVTIIPLENASADVLAQEIRTALVEASPTRAPRRARPPRPRGGELGPTITPTGAAIKIIPDLRTNALIVVANERDTHQVRALVERLDQPTPVEKNNIHIYMLSNSNAEDVSKVLNDLTKGQSTGPSTGKAAEIAAGGIRAFYKSISIVPDTATNSLIVIATPQDYAVLREVIDSLDQSRAQVLVEALIAEVSMKFTRDLGIRWFTADVGDLGIGVSAGGSGFTVPSTLTPPPDLPGDIETGIILSQIMPEGLLLGGFDSDAFAILTARESDSDFDIISAPHLMTLDNQKAVINISEEVPFIQTQRTETGGTTVGGLPQLTTFQYKDVGVSLEITPHISQEGFVRLDLVQTVSDKQTVFASTGTGEVASQFKRETETTVVVADRRTIVIGGLIKESDTVTISKVPFLGNIPVLGWAFKSRHKEREKKNLLIFIRPTIVRTPLQVAELTEQKKQEVVERLRQKIDEVSDTGGPTVEGENYSPGSGTTPADSPEELLLRPPLQMQDQDEDTIREAMPE